MATTTSKSALTRGLVASLPFLIVMLPFALVFGVVAADLGLGLEQTVWFSALVIAGAAQYTALALMQDGAPISVVVAAALAVNLRMAMYSAGLQPHLGAAPLWQRALVSYVNFDHSFALSMLDYDERPAQRVADKLRFFVGTVTLVAPLWVVCSAIGFVAGAVIPADLPIDFAMPILFLALVGPMLKTAAHVGAAAASVVVALALSFLPSGTGVLIAGVVAMAVGAEIERRRVS